MRARSLNKHGKSSQENYTKRSHTKTVTHMTHAVLVRSRTGRRTITPKTTADRIRELNKALGQPMSIYAKEAKMRRDFLLTRTPLWDAQTGRV